MSELLQFAFQPQKFLFILVLLTCGVLIMFIKDILINQFNELKITVKDAAHGIEEKTAFLRDKISQHTIVMSELSGEIGKLRQQLMTDVKTTMHTIDLIRAEIHNLENNMKKTTAEFSDQVTFVSRIRKDLEDAYGNIKRLDQDLEGLKISVTSGHDAVKKMYQVLMSHNDKIKKIGEKL